MDAATDDDEESGSGKNKGGGIRRKAKTIVAYAKQTGKAFAADLAKVRTVTAYGRLGLRYVWKDMGGTSGNT
jgi:hypothetical protein